MTSKKLLLFAGSLALNGVASFAMLAVLTRLLSPESYGLLGLCLSIATFVNAFLYQWVRAYALRSLPSASTSQEVLIIRAVVISLAASTLAGLLLVLTADHLLARSLFPGVPYLLVLTLALTQGIYEIVLAAYRSRDQDIDFAVSASSRAILSIALVSCAAYLTGSPIAVLIAISTSYFLVSAVFPRRTKLPISRSLEPRRSWKATGELKRGATYGLPLVFATSLTLLNPVVSRAYVSSHGETGVLATFVALGDVVLLVILNSLMGINLLLFNKITRSRDEGVPEVFAKCLEQYTAAIALTLVLCCACLFALSPILLPLVLGDAVSPFASSYYGVSVLAATLLAIKQFWVDQIYYLGRRTKSLALLSASGVAANVTCLLFLPINDLVARGFWAMCLANAFMIAVGVLASRREAAAMRCTRYILIAVASVLIGYGLSGWVNQPPPGPQLLHFMCILPMAIYCYRKLRSVHEQ